MNMLRGSAAGLGALERTGAPNNVRFAPHSRITGVRESRFRTVAGDRAKVPTEGRVTRTARNYNTIMRDAVAVEHAACGCLPVSSTVRPHNFRNAAMGLKFSRRKVIGAGVIGAAFF